MLLYEPLQVRNSSTLLFSALVSRIFGAKRVQDEHSVENKTTSREFFTRFPSLHGFLLAQLTKSVGQLLENRRECVQNSSCHLLPCFSPCGVVIEPSVFNSRTHQYMSRVRGRQKLHSLFSVYRSKHTSPPNHTHLVQRSHCCCLPVVQVTPGISISVSDVTRTVTPLPVSS